ncbi:MAG TPA: hypothetical protein DDZ88_23375 [Verrucomicrobiales bacterium]|nr:hypothetical protein [Verrucomicrobiales bacterium]
MTTNPDTIPGFNAVAESRKWRIATGELLNAMSLDERLAYLNRARERYLNARSVKAAAEASCVVREEPPKP